MAAGLITIAHNSAGPKLDIVLPYKGQKSGFLAETEEEYADCMLQVYKMTAQQRSAIRGAAREQVKKFSQERFNQTFMDTFNELCFEKNFKHLAKKE
jgi:alpha-1,2-mannosyltransferase